MLFTTFAFANVIVKPSIKTITINKLDEELTTTYVVEIENAHISCPIYYYVYRPDGTLMGSFTVYAPDGHEDCYGIVFYMR